VIEQLLQSNAAWQAKYRELMEIHQLISSSELEEPSLRFTRNVMDEIAKLQIAPATSAYINKNVIRGIFIFFMSLIVGFLIYGIGQLKLDWSSGGKSIIPIDFGKIDYSKIFNNTYINIFMMINIILGLFLIDRYLANKRKKRFAEES
jgi:hypothetical protein